MQNSSVNTLTVPGTGTGNPATLFKAADIPMRIAVSNIGGNTVFLAHDPSTLSVANVFTNTFQLTTTNRDVVIVLAPGQGLYAAGLGVGGTVSIAVSEALPVGTSS